MNCTGMFYLYHSVKHVRSRTVEGEKATLKLKLKRIASASTSPPSTKTNRDDVNVVDVVSDDDDNDDDNKNEQKELEDGSVSPGVKYEEDPVDGEEASGKCVFHIAPDVRGIYSGKYEPV